LSISLLLVVAVVVKAPMVLLTQAAVAQVGIVRR
jgi:hypothetical protein